MFQKTAVQVLGKNKPIIVNEPSELEMTQSIDVKKMLILGAVGGFIVMSGIFFVMYLVGLKHKFTNR